jgi:rubrerythrin
MAAMQCDAFDAAKYGRLAARARMDSDWELAEAFQETADDDRTEHFANEAELGGLVASSPENLRNAIEAEAREITMFAEFARQAKEDGDLGIASVFQRICDDKTQRRTQFQAVLADMEDHSNSQRDTAQTDAGAR